MVLIERKGVYGVETRACPAQRRVNEGRDLKGEESRGEKKEVEPIFFLPSLLCGAK